MLSAKLVHGPMLLKSVIIFFHFATVITREKNFVHPNFNQSQTFMRQPVRTVLVSVVVALQESMIQAHQHAHIVLFQCRNDWSKDACEPVAGFEIQFEVFGML